ncbi:MAG: ribonucleotide-diphosphate reductase subunit beta, partial [Bacteroidota bacterium]
MSIFDKRLNYKPFEYPEVLQFTDAINKSFWVHSEVDFTADVQDFHAHLSPAEKEVVKRSLLAIAQIEVAVKSFWGDLYHQLPKPEFNGLGSTFAECEFRHSEAYSRLLDVLGYNNEFETLVETPVIRKRIDYLTEALSNTRSSDKQSYVSSLILFSILIENVSLFSQFAIILSFTRFKGVMKNISNIIAWTSIDEQIHANAGMYIVNTIRKEFPGFFD